MQLEACSGSKGNLAKLLADFPAALVLARLTDVVAVTNELVTCHRR